MPRLFLGLDSSTQSLSAVIIDLDTRRVVLEQSLNFDRALPRYRTRNGVLPGRDPLVRHGSPRLWAEALDLMFATLRRAGAPLGEILAISGSGQQHGSVYFNDRAPRALARLDPRKTLVQNLRGVFSRATAPIWMDSSTARECAVIRQKLGGSRPTAQATGSDTFERFTGPQIRKFYLDQPQAYARTAHINLISSFMASLLAGRVAPIDFGDGAGMNLMDIRRQQWHPAALRATAPGLARKLPPLAPSGQVIGPVSPYFATKYGVNPAARATIWTGDNPASVIGLGLVQPGQAAISLGTSDTFFGVLDRCRTDSRGEGHVFGSPTGGYMTLICFKNGSLARENIRARYGLKDWAAFGRQVALTPPGNHGGILLPWFEPEIVPRVHQAGPRRFDLDATDVAANCRAIFEAQAMSLRLHSQWMKISPQSILATGGGANDRALLQTIANVFNCRVERIEVSKSAALGAALQAAHGYLAEAGQPVSWQKLTAGFAKPVPGSAIRPERPAVKVYDQLIRKYAACERAARR